MKRVLVPIDLGGSATSCILSPPRRQQPNAERIEALIDRYKERFGQVDEVFFVHGGLPTPIQSAACGGIPIRLSLSPAEFGDSDVYTRLMAIPNLVCVELEGLTAEDAVLQFCERGYTRRDQEGVIRRLRELKLRIGYVVSTGLPKGEELCQGDMDWLIEQRPDFVRIYPAQAWEGSKLSDLGRVGRWRVNDNETVHQVREWFSVLDAENIEVVRVGQQSMHDIPYKAVLGPRVDALRMRVSSLRFFDQMAGVIASSAQSHQIVLVVNPKDLAMAKGIENDNIRRLRSRLDFADIRLIVDERVRRGDVQLSRGIA